MVGYIMYWIVLYGIFLSIGGYHNSWAFWDCLILGTCMGVGDVKVVGSTCMHV